MIKIEHKQQEVPWPEVIGRVILGHITQGYYKFEVIHYDNKNRVLIIKAIRRKKKEGEEGG